MTELVLTLIGPDHPGIVETVSEVVAANGGNWLDSRMAHLAGKFAGVLCVEVPTSARRALEAALGSLGNAWPARRRRAQRRGRNPPPADHRDRARRARPRRPRPRDLGAARGAPDQRRGADHRTLRGGELRRPLFRAHIRVVRPGCGGGRRCTRASSAWRPTSWSSSGSSRRWARRADRAPGREQAGAMRTSSLGRARDRRVSGLATGG